jgi:enoyl-[acyl-carrier-protein] reductase (NADH)
MTNNRHHCLKESHPFKQLLTTNEVSDAVLFLSKCSQQINGINLIMNAGIHVI